MENPGGDRVEVPAEIHFVLVLGQQRGWQMRPALGGARGGERGGEKVCAEFCYKFANATNH